MTEVDAEVNIDAPWFEEVINGARGNGKENKFIVRKMNTSPEKKRVEFFLNKGPIDVKNPPITIRPGEDHSAEIDINCANIGEIKDPKQYQRRQYGYTKREAAKKARELLKT